MKIYFFKVLLLVPILLMTVCSREKSPAPAVITFIMGNVSKNNAEAAAGDSIKENDVITTGADSFCDIKLGESVLRIQAGSGITVSSMLINSERESTVILLEEGSLLCRVKKMVNADYFFVKTPVAVASAGGTQFSVESDKLLTTRIKVFSGEVKAIIRIKQFDADYGRFLEYATAIREGQNVIITDGQFRDTNGLVERVLKEETARGGAARGNVIEKVIRRTEGDVVIKRNRIQKFNPGDFAGENLGIIQVDENPGDVARRVATIVRKEREMPTPEGRLLIAANNIYFIKDGGIKWQGGLKGYPVRKGDRLFIAAGDYVFCALSDGPIVWKKQIINDGSIEMKDGRVIVNSSGKFTALDELTGN